MDGLHFRKMLAALLAAAAFSAAIPGCKNAPAQSSGSKSGSNVTTVVNVGDQPAFFLFKIAQEKGFFAKELGGDVKVNVVSFVKQGPAIVESMASKNVDLAMLGTLPIVTANANGNPIVALASGNYSEKGFALFVNPDSGIKTVEELKGKTVGMPFGTNDHEAVVELLEKHNLSSGDVKLMNMESADALTALKKGHIEAALLKGNSFYSATQAGEVKIADNSETGPIANLIVGRKNFVEKNPEITEKFLKACAEAAKYIESNPEESIRIAAKITGASEDDEKINYESRSRLVSIDDQYVTVPLQKAIDFAKKQSLISKDVTVEEILNTSCFSKAGIA